MSNYIIRVPDRVVTLRLALVDNVTPANNPITGETCLVSIRRLSDDKWYDFVAAAWDTVAFGSLATEHKQALTDKGDGTYEYDWDQGTADGGVERTYEMYYRVTSAGDFLNMVSQEEWVFTDEAGAASAGNGAAEVNVTLLDDNGDPVPAVLLAAIPAAGTAFWARTNGDGVASYRLDNGDYRFSPRASALYIWGEDGCGYYEGTVTGDTDLAFEAVKIVVPGPSDPALCACYLDVREVTGQMVGAGGAWLTVKYVHDPAFPTADAEGVTLVPVDDVYYSTGAGAGRIQLDLVRGATVEFSMGVGGSPTGGNLVVKKNAKTTIPDEDDFNLATATWQ